MKTLTKLLLIVVLVMAGIPSLANGQNEGCADALDEDYGARYRLLALNGFTLNLIAVGVDGFDPTITLLDAEGEIVACSDNAENATDFAAHLPSIEASAADSSAAVSIRVPGNQGRLDYEVIVGSADKTSGEFLLIYNGAQIFGSTNVDQFEVVSTDAMGDGEVPLGLYAVNLDRPALVLDPTLRFTFGANVEVTCYKSSATTLCEGDHQDLANPDYFVTLDGESQLPLFGDDAMLYFELGGDGAVYQVEVASYNGASFGAYTLLIHSGVVYPSEG